MERSISEADQLMRNQSSSSSLISSNDTLSTLANLPAGIDNIAQTLRPSCWEDLVRTGSSDFPCEAHDSRSSTDERLYTNSRDNTLEQHTEKSDDFLPRYKLRYGNLKELARFDPELDPSSKRAQTLSTKWHSRRIAITFQLSLASCVLIFNLAVTIYLWVKYRLWRTNRAFGEIYTGSCDVADKVSLWTHLAINVLSTMLLGASNYAMQLFVAPTTKQIRKAHSSGSWLDIGVPSMRNLKRMTPSRVACWTLLCLSSGTLHLVWNTAIIRTYPYRGYLRAYATYDFDTNLNPWQPQAWDMDLAFANLQVATRDFERLSPPDCVARYFDPLQASQDLVLVLSNTNSNDITSHGHVEYANTSLIRVDSPATGGSEWYRGQSWLCYPLFRHENLPDLPAHAPACSTVNLDPLLMDWPDPFNGSYSRSEPVSHCLSKGPPTQGMCEVQFSMVILLIVCIMNALKVLCMIVLFCLDADPKASNKSMVLLGDAVQYFLSSAHTDNITAGKCLWSKADVVRQRIQNTESAERCYSRFNQRLWRAATRRRWIVTMVACLSIISVGIVFLIVAAVGISTESLRGKWVFTQGLGKSSNLAVIGGPLKAVYSKPAWAFLVASIFPNSFQLFVSMIYFASNSLLTNLAVAQEWGHLDNKERKTLRVSHPVGRQRSSYFLSLPFRISVPLMLSTTLLHWFISQAVFPIRTAFIDHNDNRIHDRDGTCVGFSVLGIILSLMFGLLILAALISAGYQRYRSSMPMASTCSLAIAAGCHRPDEDNDAHLLPIRWGPVSCEGDVGHCAFSTEADDMRPDGGESPKDGKTYA